MSEFEIPGVEIPGVEMDGGPAFPYKPMRRERVGDNLFRVNPGDWPGMTLRDYFAIHASWEDIKAQAEVMRVNGSPVLPDGWITKARYMHADEMLKARQGSAK